MMSLRLHTDWRLRHEAKRLPPHLSNYHRRGADEALILFHQERVAVEEPLHAEEDAEKRRCDMTGHRPCARCGEEHGHTTMVLCRVCSAEERRRATGCPDGSATAGTSRRR